MNIKNNIYKVVIKWLLVILALLVLLALNSCSDARQLMKIQKRSPWLFTKTTDTMEVISEIPILIPSVKTDTSNILIPLHYTFTYENERAKVEITQKAKDTFDVALEAKEIDFIKIDTLRVPYPVYIPNTAPKKNDLLTYSVIGGFFLLVVTYIVVLYYRYRLIKQKSKLL